MSSIFLSQLAPKALPSVAYIMLPKIEVSSSMLFFVKKKNTFIHKVLHMFRLSCFQLLFLLTWGKKKKQPSRLLQLLEEKSEWRRKETVYSAIPFKTQLAAEKLEHTAKHCSPFLVKSFIKKSIK